MNFSRKNNRPDIYALIALLTLMLIYICSFVDRQIIAVLASQIRVDLNFTNTQMGVLYGPAFSLVYAFCGIFMGRMADRFSRKYIILTGLLIWSMMTFASGFANSFAFLVSARFAIGVSQSALSPSVYSLLADYFNPKHRARVFSVYASGIFIGVGLSFLIGGSIAENYDWRIALKSVGLPGVGLAVLGYFLLKEPSREKSENAQVPDQSFFEVLSFILKKPTVRYHLMGFSLLALSGYSILAFIGTILTDVFESSNLISSYGWFMFATGVSVNLSGLMADKLALKFGEEKRFISGILAALGGLPFYYFGLFAETALMGLILIGIANVISSSYNGVAAALIQDFVGSKMRGVAGSVYLFVVSIVGFGIGPPVTGWLMDNIFTGSKGPSQAMFSVFLVCGILATACFFKAMRSYEGDRV
ncbi:MAG TPA: MFS transporter [Balneola sp.]|jgi:MFS family permease|nr:MFS transporter [Balneola sp.]MAO78610.1 MFS transporter [Balneola sp.]MBF63161.1 MFS transporter [Balneola sp.]HAH51253.1 MFS transporter [Balneola sp.]HBZ38402.1 MFS transporter [Balneola sp.]|tara:strand:+ start:12715 stop:13968 length:1254 start_codon:yes stop_codon:yes gene_type:complete